MSKTVRSANVTRVQYAELSTPIGRIYPAWSGNTLLAIAMAQTKDRGSWTAGDRPGNKVHSLRRELERRYGPIELERAGGTNATLKQLDRYFHGDVSAIRKIRVDPGGTEFQAAVWKLLRSIPAGRTMTYGELAAQAGRPGAARAAGRAVGSNPIPIAIPCHRVVGKSGSLTGFGGGLPRKRWLLEHEGGAPR
ncbi:MAG TPA: methylated-DNA--[protein]-cysteine S-methyltransferase [bacterium]|nr:methylated-DNA--[protein]-cysteine S-methyltransferase [bacterium]